MHLRNKDYRVIGGRYSTYNLLLIFYFRKSVE